MPWLTIIITLISFFAAKKSGMSNTQAALTAGLVGAGTYYVSHETEWGRNNLGALDGVELNTGLAGPNDNVPDGTTSVGADGKVTVGATTPTGGQVQSGTGVLDLLKDWGATGTATVLGTGAAAAGGLFNNKALLWGGLAILAVVVLN